MRPGMICPPDRGGCGKLLEWDDGAFCKECITKGLYERLERMGIKPLDSGFKDKEGR